MAYGYDPYQEQDQGHPYAGLAGGVLGGAAGALAGHRFGPVGDALGAVGGAVAGGLGGYYGGPAAAVGGPALLAGGGALANPAMRGAAMDFGRNAADMAPAYGVAGMRAAEPAYDAMKRAYHQGIDAVASGSRQAAETARDLAGKVSSAVRRKEPTIFDALDQTHQSAGRKAFQELEHAAANGKVLRGAKLTSTKENSWAKFLQGPGTNLDETDRHVVRSILAKLPRDATAEEAFHVFTAVRSHGGKP